MFTQFSNTLSEKSIPLFYLSPYIKILFTNSGILINNTATSKKFLIPGDTEKLKELVNNLRSGISEESLILQISDLVENSDSENLVNELIQLGVVE